MFVIYLENILDNDALAREFHWVIHARFSEISNYYLSTDTYFEIVSVRNAKIKHIQKQSKQETRSNSKQKQFKAKQSKQETRSNLPTFGPDFLHQSQQRPNYRQPKNCQRHHSRTHNKTRTTCHRSESHHHYS